MGKIRICGKYTGNWWKHKLRKRMKKKDSLFKWLENKSCIISDIEWNEKRINTSINYKCGEIYKSHEMKQYWESCMETEVTKMVGGL